MTHQQRLEIEFAAWKQVLVLLENAKPDSVCGEFYGEMCVSTSMGRAHGLCKTIRLLGQDLLVAPLMYERMKRVRSDTHEFWWPRNLEGKAARIKFCEKMIADIEKELKNVSNS